MYEIELKVRADHGPVRDRLEDLGATRMGQVTQVDVYYDHPTRSFADTDEALRVRREPGPAGTADRAVLTYKGPLVETESKTRRELEAGLDEPDALEAILQALDFTRVAEVRKDRERYALEGFTVTLDTVDGAGSFVEIEREGEAEEIERLREVARGLLVELGLDPEDHVRTPYLAMVLDG